MYLEPFYGPFHRPLVLLLTTKLNYVQLFKGGHSNKYERILHTTHLDFPISDTDTCLLLLNPSRTIQSHIMEQGKVSNQSVWFSSIFDFVKVAHIAAHLHASYFHGGVSPWLMSMPAKTGSIYLHRSSRWWWPRVPLDRCLAKKGDFGQETKVSSRLPLAVFRCSRWQSIRMHSYKGYRWGSLLHLPRNCIVSMSRFTTSSLLLQVEVDDFDGLQKSCVTDRRTRLNFKVRSHGHRISQHCMVKNHDFAMCRFSNFHLGTATCHLGLAQCTCSHFSKRNSR